jgi:hypothetical protein
VLRWPGRIQGEGGSAMLRYAVAGALLAVLLPNVAAFAVTSKDKMATCKFGADDQNLQGNARNAFMKKCMSNKDDPRGAAMAPPGAPPPPQH